MLISYKLTKVRLEAYLAYLISQSVKLISYKLTKVGLEAYLAYLIESINYANQLQTYESEAWSLRSILHWVNQLC